MHHQALSASLPPHPRAPPRRCLLRAKLRVPWASASPSTPQSSARSRGLRRGAVRAWGHEPGGRRG